MHIPDPMLQGAICPLSATVAVIGVAGAAYFCVTAKNQPTPARFAAISALIFALQMLNFPISGGTSGHLLGGVLASATLGVPFGVLAITLVVAIQALIFSDGGLSVLGANVLNMALLGAGLGGLLNANLQSSAQSWISRSASLAFASWISVVLASFAVSVELALDGKADLFAVSSAMVGTHALIGIGEVIITLLCYPLLHTQTLARSRQMSSLIPLFASLVVAFLLSPFASGLPDGLEWVAGQYQLFHETAPAFVGIMPDYIFPFISDEALATSLAGVSGVMLTFGLSWMLLRLMGKVTPQMA